MGTYAGHANDGSNGLGFGFYCNNSHCYHGKSSTAYNIDGAVCKPTIGSYIAMILDVDNKQVTFLVNGRPGAALTLSDSNEYYVSVSTHNRGDCIKLCSKQCKKLN